MITEAALFFVLAFLLGVGVLHYKKAIAAPKWGKRIPGPPQWPLLGNLPLLLKNAVNNYELFYQLTLEYGDVFTVCLTQVGIRLVIINNPTAIRYLVNQALTEGLVAKGPEFQKQYRELFGEGIFNSNGVEWQAHREFAKSLFQPESLAELSPVFIRNAHALIAYLDAKGMHTGVDMQDMFMRYTLASFGEAGFGAQLHSIEQDVNQFAVAFDDVQTRSFERGFKGKLWQYLPNDKQFVSSLRYLNGYCADLLRERQKEKRESLAARKDLLSRLLVSTHADGSPFAESEILDFLRNFLIAGRDTTAVLLTFCVYELARHPEVERRVLAEMEEVVGEGELTMAKVQQLRYTKAVLQETLRLYPPVPGDGYTVMAPDGVNLPGTEYNIPKDTFLMYTALALHRNESLWPEPLKFDPTRFVDTTPRPFTYMPFHGGPRQCLGMDMAYLEARMALVVLLRKYKFVLADGFKPAFKAKLILTSSNGMRMNLLPRIPA